MVVFTRSHSQNGGVGMYVKSNLSASPRKDLDCSNDDFETVWIEVDRKNEKNLLFCCVYRHPNSNVESLTFHLNDILLKVTQSNKLAFIMGDFNVNLLNYNSDTQLVILSIISSLIILCHAFFTQLEFLIKHLR